MGEEAIAAVETLRCPDGGYAERAGQTASQTSATAAAVGLPHHERCPVAGKNGRDGPLPRANAERRRRAASAHADVAAGDLLSTYTGLLTLWGLGRTSADRRRRRGPIPAHAWRTPAADSSPATATIRADVEYTYYGVGTLAAPLRRPDACPSMSPAGGGKSVSHHRLVTVRRLRPAREETPHGS